MFHSHSVGATSEFSAAAWFSSRGYELFWPVASSSGSVDFIAVKGNKRYKVQVKTGSEWSNGRKSYLRIDNGKARSRKQYRRDDLDVMFVVSPRGWMLWLPFEELPKRQAFHIRLDKDYRPEQAKWTQWMIR